MDVWKITVAALRRWYIFLPLLALSAFAAVVVGQGVTPQYEARATGILVPGAESSEVESPYGSLDSTATVLAIVLDDAMARERLSAQGLQSDYEFDARNRTRIMDVEVLSESPELSLATATAVLDMANHELADRQAEVGIPPSAQVSLQVLRAPAIADVVTEGKMRNMAVVGIVGAALSLLVAVLFDDLVGLVRAWRRRRSSPKEPAGHSTPETSAKRRGLRRRAVPDTAEPRTASASGNGADASAAAPPGVTPEELGPDESDPPELDPEEWHKLVRSSRQS